MTSSDNLPLTSGDHQPLTSCDDAQLMFIVG